MVSNQSVAICGVQMKDKVILVTGATGSFGTAFIGALFNRCPDIKSIRAYSRGEYLQSEMRRKFTDTRLRFLIGDVRDESRLRRAMEGCDIVVHAAAMKRIEACQYNPIEAYKTNVLGTQNVVDASIDARVGRVLGISSDKAVEPINVYGSTKLAMEHIILSGNLYGNTKFSVLRPGNFVSSRGNVRELWKRQLDENITPTVTDMAMCRYWIETEDLALLTINLLDYMEGGEIFVPKMKEEPILNTLTSCGITNVRIIGRRPGEKLQEKIFAENENPEDRGDFWEIRPKQAEGC